MTGTEVSLYGMLLTLSVLAGIGKGRQLTATASGWRLGDLPQQSPMPKLGIPGLILAVVAIHLGLAYPALSRYVPLGLKTVETALSLASLVALCHLCLHDRGGGGVSPGTSGPVGSCRQWPSRHQQPVNWPTHIHHPWEGQGHVST